MDPRRIALASLLAWGAVAPVSTGLAQDSAAPAGRGAIAYRIVGDAIPEPLSATPGDAVRGRAIVADRSLGLCLLCHTAPVPEERFQGDIAPDLKGAAARWSQGQLRLRLVDARQLNPESVMPSYHALQHRHRVGASWRGKTILTAQQIEDVLAYLQTLGGATP
jgi:L-cysteine S-thiosulfotransferase